MDYNYGKQKCAKDGIDFESWFMKLNYIKKVVQFFLQAKMRQQIATSEKRFLHQCYA